MATVCGLQLLCGLAKRVGNTRVAVMIYVLQGAKRPRGLRYGQSNKTVLDERKRERGKGKGNKQGACRAMAKRAAESPVPSDVVTHVTDR